MKKLILFIILLAFSISGFSQAVQQLGRFKRLEVQDLFYSDDDSIFAPHPDSVGQYRLMNIANPSDSLDVVNYRTLVQLIGAVNLYDSIRFDSIDGYLRAYIDGSVYDSTNMVFNISEFYPADSTQIDSLIHENDTLKAYQGTNLQQVKIQERQDSTRFDISDGYVRFYLNNSVIDSLSLDDRYHLIDDTIVHGVYDIDTVLGTHQVRNYSYEFENTSYYFDVFAWYNDTILGQIYHVENGIRNLTKTTTGFTLDLEEGKGWIRYLALDTIELNVADGFPDESDPVWLSDSSGVAKLAENETITGDYTHTGTLTIIDGTIDAHAASVGQVQDSIDELVIYYGLYQGLKWNASTDVYTRLGSIKNIAVSQSAGNDNLPIQSEMKRCMLTDEGTVAYYIDPDNPHNYLETTELLADTSTWTKTDTLCDSGADFVTDGVVAGMVVKNVTDGTFALITGVTDTALALRPSIFTSGELYEVGTAKYGGQDGQVMVEIPKFYYKQSQSGNDRYWYISLYKLPGYSLHPAFFKDGQEVDYRYYSAFEGSMYDSSAVAMTAKGSIHSDIYATGDKFCSVAGTWPKTSETHTEYHAGSIKRGEGWRNVDFALNTAVQLLYLVEYAEFNTQGEISAGRTALSGGGWTADSYIGMTGLSVGLGNGSGGVSIGGTSGYLTDYMSYRGIENWYGNVYKILSGITIDGRWTGIAAAQPTYFTNNFDYFKEYGSENMTWLCDADYIGTLGNYIYDFENNFGFIPNKVGASTGYVGDYYWQYSESARDYWRVCLFGASAYGGGVAGGFAFYAYSVWSYAAAAVAGRLAY